MKARALFFSLVLAGAAFAAVQDEVKFSRAFKAGEKDKYTFNVKGKMTMGDLDITLNMTQEILKVHDNGDADQKTTISDIKVLMNGADITQMVPPEAFGKPTEVRITKTGQPVDKSKAQSQGPAGMGQLLSIGGSVMSDKPLKVGQTIPINEVDPKDPKSKVTGSLLVESVTAGVAKVITNLEITNAQMTSPMKINSTSWIDVASAKPNKVQGTLSGMPESQGMTFENMSFTMERAK